MSAIELVSPFPPDECVARLREAADDDWVFLMRGKRPVRGRVSRRSVRLRIGDPYNNPCRVFLVARLEECGTGAVLRGRAGERRFPGAFTTIWFILVVVFGAGMLGLVLAELLGAGVESQPSDGLLLKLAMVAGCALLLAIGTAHLRFHRWLARDEERFLVNYVASVLQAAPAKVKVPESTEALDWS